MPGIFDGTFNQTIGLFTSVSGQPNMIIVSDRTGSIYPSNVSTSTMNCTTATTTGDILCGGSVQCHGTVAVNQFSGYSTSNMGFNYCNLSQISTLSATTITVSGAISGASISAASLAAGTGGITSSGLIQAYRVNFDQIRPYSIGGNISFTNTPLVIATNITVSSNLTVSNVSTSGNVNFNSANISGGNYSSINCTGNVNASNIISTNISTSGNVYFNASNISGGTYASINCTGNVNASNVISTNIITAPSFINSSGGYFWSVYGTGGVVFSGSFSYIQGGYTRSPTYVGVSTTSTIGPGGAGSITGFANGYYSISATIVFACVNSNNWGLSTQLAAYNSITTSSRLLCDFSDGYSTSSSTGMSTTKTGSMSIICQLSTTDTVYIALNIFNGCSVNIGFGSQFSGALITQLS